jgi:hypothetical protein
MKRVISQGQATRSTCTCERVTHFIVISFSIHPPVNGDLDQANSRFGNYNIKPKHSGFVPIFRACRGPCGPAWPG